MTNCICFATLAAANSSTPTIPPGTPAVVIEQFDVNSDVSAAVYVPYLGGSGGPGHALSFQNGGNWWTIHPDYVTLEAAGAPTGTADCAPAMQRVLDYSASSAVTQTSLKLGAQDYMLNTLASIVHTNTGRGFSVIGRGPSVSRLLVPPPGEGQQTGAFAVTFIDDTSEFLYRDFAVVATGATRPMPGCTVGIRSQFTTGQVPIGRHNGIIENVRVGNDGVEVGGISWGFFVTGIDVTGTPYPLVSHVSITGCFGPNLRTDYADDSPRYYAQTLLVVDECHGPRIFACELWHATLAVSAVSTTNVQSFLMNDCDIEGVRTAVLHSHAYSNNPNPAGTLSNNDVQFRDVGFDLGNVTKWRATGNQFRNEWSDTLPQGYSYDMRFRDAHAVVLTGNSFGTQDANPNRSNIFLDGATAVNGSSGVNNFLVDTHQFGDGMGSGSVLSAIRIIPAASNIQIGASNQFLDAYSVVPVDDPTGVAVTQIGFANNSSTNPAAVIPNDGPMLGSANAPWLNTVSQLHTIPASSEPGAPASGGVLYTVNNTLWVRFSDGSTKQLAP